MALVSDEKILVALSKNQYTPIEVRERGQIAVATNGDKEDRMLLAQSEAITRLSALILRDDLDIGVRLQLAANLNAPIEIIQFLMKNEENYTVRWQAAETMKRKEKRGIK